MRKLAAHIKSREKFWCLGKIGSGKGISTLDLPAPVIQPEYSSGEYELIGNACGLHCAVSLIDRSRSPKEDDAFSSCRDINSSLREFAQVLVRSERIEKGLVASRQAEKAELRDLKREVGWRTGKSKSSEAVDGANGPNGFRWLPAPIRVRPMVPTSCD